MTQLIVAGADRSAPAAPATAADLAARIALPVKLPERHDGEPLRHLSPSSYSLWVSCPEAWRRRYIKGEKPPPSGSMFLGSRVDDALSAYHRRILEHGDRLALGQLLDLYREMWQAELDAEREKRGIDWHEDLPERAAFELGRQAIELAMAELVPHLGEPVEVQRRLEFTLAPGLEWTVLCYLDLETVKPQAGGDPIHAVVDFKVKGSPIGQDQADSDPQAGLYLAGRWLEGRPAKGLLFAQIAKPGKRRKQMSASLIGTTRTAGQLRGVLARVALAASQIAAAYERYGPDRAWGFADPTGWKCSPRWCSHWRHCPGGAGLH
ncbi:MAG TPA: PD-(D/E)XK nuclease family protein [Solirubrobacteraceae bacterium]|nr:PD-(D/E)XK nuclease family protein [Solirubrobacteraceae bacterium]